MNRVLFFDLDGTLTNPREGIVRSLKYAFDKLGCPCPLEDTLEGYIGTPLRTVFAELIDSSGEQIIERAVELYRERFAREGMFENLVYPGIEASLTKLNQQGLHLYVTTSKATVFAVKIIEHFNLESHFRRVYGSELDGTRADKEELIAYVLAEESISPRDATMIGDRDHDIKGALSNGVRPVGALWGFGSRDELTRAGASVLCESPEALVKTLSDRN